MWFAFGILTFAVALVTGWNRRMGASWGGEMRTLVAQPPNTGLDYQFRELEKVHKIWVGVAAPTHFRFSARLERPFDRVLKGFGISYEMQLKDAGFDRLIYLEADAKGIAHWLKDSQETRNQLLSILQNAGMYYGGAAVVRCANGRLWLECSAHKNERNRLLSIVVPKLHKLSASMQAQRLQPHQLHDPFMWRAAALLSISTASLLLGVYGLVRSMGRTDILASEQLLHTSIPLGLAMLVPLIIITMRALDGSSRRWLVLLEILLLGAPGFVLSTYALAREANMEFDSAPARVYELEPAFAQRGESRYFGRRRGRKLPHYVLTTHNWPSDLPQKRRLDITADEYHALAGTFRAAMVVRPGAFGYAWIERVMPAPNVE